MTALSGGMDSGIQTVTPRPGEIAPVVLGVDDTPEAPARYGE
jgi:hypothetical protein